MFIQRKSTKIVADTEPVDVAPEAAELLFEAEDVAELVAEVTGQPVEVTADEETVTFAIGEEEFIIEPEEGIEEVESCKKMTKAARPVSASTKRDVKATKTVRKMPSSK